MLCSILVSQLIRRLPKQLLHLLARIIPVSVIVTASAGVHPVILHQLLALQIILVPGKSCIRPAEKLIQAGQPACGKLFEIAASCPRFLGPAFLPLCSCRIATIICYVVYYIWSIDTYTDFIKHLYPV